MELPALHQAYIILGSMSLTRKGVVHRIMANQDLTASSKRAYLHALYEIKNIAAPYCTTDANYRDEAVPPKVAKRLSANIAVVKEACEGLAAAIEGSENAKYAGLKAKVLVSGKAETQSPASPRGSVIENYESTAMVHLHKVIKLVEGARARFERKERELAKVKGEWEATKVELEHARGLMKKALEELGKAISANDTYSVCTGCGQQDQ